jgi:polyhydroxyalkanoate synthesis regulator phasin
MSMLTSGARSNVGRQISSLLSEGKITQQQANTFRSNMGLTASAPSPTPAPAPAPAPAAAATPIITNAQAISALKSQLNARMENVMYRGIAVNAAGNALNGNVKAQMSMLTSGARSNVGTQINTLLTEGKITQQQAATFDDNMGVS